MWDDCATLVLIAKAIDGEIPMGQAWHVDLLRQMMVATEKRSTVITSELAFDLREYLSFRHFFRHAYEYTLDWERMGHLVTQLPTIQAQFVSAIDQFLTAYE